MDMCYNGTLVLPSSYAVMSEDEMTYVEGGVSLPMKSGYLNKNNCMNVAARYVSSTGLSQSRIAKEIYAHAVMYYASTTALVAYSFQLAVTLGVAGLAMDGCLLWIRSHANPVDIGNDSAFRESVYNAVWSIL